MRNSTQRLDECRRPARRMFGIERLRPEQDAAMSAVLEGRDALMILWTDLVLNWAPTARDIILAGTP